MKDLARSAAEVSKSLIVGHCLLTTVGNLPDQYLQINENLAPWGLDVPTWKFFGPNPGIENTSIFARLADESSPIGQWTRIDRDHQRPWHALLWNPGSRRPKVAFDATQQIRKMAVQLNGSAAMIEHSAPFTVLKRFVFSKILPENRALKHQIMILVTRPGRHDDYSYPAYVSTPVNRSSNIEGASTPGGE